MTGEQMYEAWRTAMNTAADLRGNSREPRWKDLKPWLKAVWRRAAESAGGAR